MSFNFPCSTKNILVIDNRSEPRIEQIASIIREQCRDAKATFLVKNTARLRNRKNQQFGLYFRKSPLSILEGLKITLYFKKTRPDVILIRKHDFTLKFFLFILICMPAKVYFWRIHSNTKVSLSQVRWRSFLIRRHNKPYFLISLICSLLPLAFLVTFLLLLRLKKHSPTEKRRLYYGLKSNLQRGPLGDSPWLWAWLQLIMLWVFVFGKPAKDEAPTRILVIRNDHIGDAINTVPLIRYLRKNYPKAKITILCDMGVFLWKNCPYIDEVLLYKTNNPLFNRGRRKLRYILRPFTYWPVLHKKKFDLVLDSVGRTETHIISYLCAAAKRISNTYYPYQLFANTVACRHYESQLHETKRALSLAKPSNKINDGECGLEIWLSKEKTQLADSYLEQHGISQKDKILGIHAGAASSLRLWPVKRYSAVASKLADEYNMRIIFFEPPGNVEITQQFISSLSKLGTKVIVIRAPDLISLTAFISKCTLFICNDSGPMHLAAATKIPMVAVFGPGEYFRWKPLHLNSAVVRKFYICSPCSQNYCSRPYCILQVEASDVLIAAENILSSVRKIQHENGANL